MDKQEPHTGCQTADGEATCGAFRLRSRLTRSVGALPGIYTCTVIRYSWRCRVPVIRTCSKCGQQNRVPTKFFASTGRCGACKSPLPPISEPLAVDDQLFDEIVQNSPVPVLVDFWAAWCQPCVMAAPEVARTSCDMAGKAIVLKVDTEKYPQLAGRFKVNGIPNFVIHGRPVVLQQPGLVDHDQMERWLNPPRLFQRKRQGSTGRIEGLTIQAKR